MLAAFLTVIPQTPSLVLVTYRPEYRGALTRVPGAPTIALAPLSDSETTALVFGLLGRHPTVGEVGKRSPSGPLQSDSQSVSRPSQPGGVANFCWTKLLNVALIAGPPLKWSMLWKTTR